MDRQDLLDQLTTGVLGRPLFLYDSTDSTSTQATLALASGRVGHGAAFVAARQTAGRGADGSRWESSEADGLWMSLVLESPAPSTAAALALMPGIAVAAVLRDSWGIDAHLKWPNDVMVGTRKIAGVLVESRRVASGGLSHVVGIGVNLHQTSFPAPLRHSAVSARMVRGDRLPTPIFFGQLMSAIEALWAEPATWVDLWLSRTRMIGRRATLHDGLGERSVDVVGVSREGALQVRGQDGEVEQIISRTGLDVRVHWLDAQPAQASWFSGVSA